MAPPNQAVGFEILMIVYEHFLANAGIGIGAGNDTYQNLLRECEDTFAVGNGNRAELAFQRYFGLRANTGAVGAAFAARHPWPGGSAAVQAYIATLVAADGTPTLSLDRTDTFYILGINDRAQGQPEFHITIPRNPTGRGVGHPTNYTMHFTDEVTGLHVYHRFTNPRGHGFQLGNAAAAPVAAAPAAAAPAAAAPAAAAPPRRRWAEPTGPPPGGPRPGSFDRKGGKSRRKTKRSKRGRRTRRR